jgi:hypothetical protein
MDTFAVGAADAVFFDTDASHLVLEVASGGADTIIISPSMTSQDHVESLRMVEYALFVTYFADLT